MEVTIPVTVADDERCRVLETVLELNSREHVTQMPVASIAEMSGLSLSKTRYVLNDLLHMELLKRFNVTTGKQKLRYYYAPVAGTATWLQQHKEKV